jgi:hypothetical protein
MPIFDGSSSRPRPVEADLLRGVLGPAKPRDTSLRAASRAYHQAQRRNMLMRALAVTVLLGGFFGSATLMSQRQPSQVSVATRTLDDPVATGSIGPALRRPRDAAQLRSLERAASIGPEDPPDRRP